MPVIITPITLEHLAGFWNALDHVAKEKKFLMMTKAPEITSTEKFVKNNIENNYPQFVALVNDKVVGWCDAIPEEKEGVKHVGYLGIGIMADFRGQGIGKKLIETVISDAWKKGFKRIELEVYASNKNAIALYEKFGFINEGCKRKARFLDNVWDNSIIMALLNE